MSLSLYQTGERGKADVLNRPWQQFLALFGYQQDGSDFTGLDRAFFAAQRAQGVHWVTDPTYGASTSATAAENSTAIQAAIDAAGTTGFTYIPKGSFSHAGFALKSGTRLIGAGSGVTTLTYTGTGTAIVPATPGTRLYNVHLKGFHLTTTAGLVGIDLDSVSQAIGDDVVVTGFDEWCFKIWSATSGGAVYNRFYQCKAQSAANGWLIAPVSTNATVLVGCRANIITGYGFRIEGSNDNTLIACQGEQCGTAYSVYTATAGAAGVNRFAFCRAENNTVGFEIASSGVRDTIIEHPWLGSNGTNISDPDAPATRTQIISSTHGYESVSEKQVTPFVFRRIANGGTEQVAFLIEDTNTSAGTPVTVHIKTGRSAGYAQRWGTLSTTYAQMSAVGVLEIGNGGTTLKRVAAPSVSTDKGDTGLSLTSSSSETTQVFATPLTADRAVTLPSTGQWNGQRYRVVRRATATGAFNLNVRISAGTVLKALTAGQWCDVEWDGSAWLLTAFGSL